MGYGVLLRSRYIDAGDPHLFQFYYLYANYSDSTHNIHQSIIMSNETNQENTRSVTIVATAITVVLSFLTVLLRLISRLAVVRRVTLDDLFIVIAWVYLPLPSCCC